METMSSGRSEGDATNEALLLRAMWKKDASVTFYEKTPYLCQVHKNRQNSVEIIRHILREEGMDAREMKKAILYDALERYQRIHEVRDPKVTMSIFMDRDSDTITPVMVKRFRNVLAQMVLNAESKI